MDRLFFEDKLNLSVAFGQNILDEQVNIIAAVVLSPCTTRSAATILTDWERQVFVIKEAGFQVCHLHHLCWELKMRKMQIYFYVFSEKYSTLMINNHLINNMLA